MQNTYASIQSNCGLKTETRMDSTEGHLLKSISLLWFLKEYGNRVVTGTNQTKT